MWSRLCGADVLIGAGPSDAEHISAPVRSLGALEMRASISLRAEREAAALARSNLLEAGALVLGLVMLASYLLARRTMAPILALQRAVLAVGEGDFSVRVDDSRSDEIGDLARGVNRMAAQLGVHEAERAAANIELVRAKTAAEVASRTKSQFLANVSHELRTPLTAILGYADLLLEQPEVKTQASSYEAMRGVQRSGDHLLALIDDFLDLSQVEAGKLQLHEAPCCVRDLFSELADLLRSRAREKGLGFTVSVAPEVPEVLVLDPTRVRQILLNLTSNALKFTERGGVNVLCELQPHPQGATLLKISVSDSGIGMTAEQLAHVFEPFYQADSSPTRIFGGTGLGLTVSRRLIEVLGGTLQVESEFGRGSTFCVRLPAARGTSLHPTLSARASAAEEQRAEPSLPRGLRVLLAEDGPDNQKVLGFMLKKLGVDACTVQNGQLALEAALEAEALGDPFRVVLMDMQMPVLDGYAATAELRARGYTGPIVALTAHAMRGDRERCLAAGCDDYLTKPTTRGRLATAIARALGKLEKPGDG
jgi:signal transduction histidine kinase/ActR/RegA family two-component response regulator